MIPNIPKNEEHHEAAQAEVDRIRKEWLKSQPPEVRESFDVIENALSKCKLPIYLVAFANGVRPIHYHNVHKVSQDYSESTKLYNVCLSLILHDLQTVVTRDNNNIRIIVEHNGTPIKVYEKEQPHN